MFMCNKQQHHTRTQTGVPNLSKAVGLTEFSSDQYSGFRKREIMQLQVFLKAICCCAGYFCAVTLYLSCRQLHAWQAERAAADYNAIAGTSRASASSRHCLQAQLTHQENTISDAVLAGCTQCYGLPSVLCAHQHSLTPGHMCLLQ
eukprot:16456-Heterococcus_DN1.PRE.2